MNRRAFVTAVRLSGFRRLAYGARRAVVVPLLLFFSVVLSGCASMLPAPPQVTVRLATNTATAYYSVRATTTDKIFEEIKASGLREENGRFAAGLASAKSEIRWTARETGALCTPQSVTIALDIVVTLPRHEHANDLTQDLRERWEHFSASVVQHEQGHVDIFVKGANAAKASIDAVLKKWVSCADLERTLRRLWEIHEAETEKAQREFDAADRARLDEDRKPLQAAIDAKQARLTSLTAEIRQIDMTLRALSSQAGAVREHMSVVRADIAKVNGTCSRPTDGVEALCQYHNVLAANHNAIAAEHASVVAQRNKLADEHRVLVESINEQIETLNWVY